ncbi:hypothetical protein [Sphingomonas sp.]|uniref:hypothetical protein n=1 Tax=Sphingomonas sp. TaxID=28214 RepID=UPI0017C0BE74|nr:hypothetical protein [Sphingomonas sp.]MBA3512309.1 hypothetical protein [Sphingomonas sp.]
MRQAFALLLTVSVCAASVSPGVAAGPDVIVGFVDDAREDSRLGTTQVGITASTNACNIGDQPVNWMRLPDKRHPAITLNLYRLQDGRMEQMAASWVKHGFYATNQDDCSGLREVPMPCQPGSGGNRLRPGCSDLYTEDLNANPANLGPRSRIDNPASGDFDGNRAQDLTGYPSSIPAERILLVEESALAAPTARFFVEAHYVAADDAVAGNSRNNVTYREVKPVLRNGSWVLRNASEEVRLQPAAHAWREAGAQLTEIEGLESGIRTFALVGSKATRLADGRYRYDYLVYNMNSDLAFNGFSVPVSGVDMSSVWFKSMAPKGEIWSTSPWTGRADGGRLVWSTAAYEADPKANAIRWGTSFNFSFVSSAAPGTANAVLTRFRRPADPTAQTVSASVIAPGN